MTEICFEIDNSLVCLDDIEHETNIYGQHVYYREGVWCEKYDGEFMPDWSLTWFYTDQNHPENYLYYEQDPPDTAIHNLKNYIASTIPHMTAQIDILPETCLLSAS